MAINKNKYDVVSIGGQTAPQVSNKKLHDYNVVSIGGQTSPQVSNTNQIPTSFSNAKIVPNEPIIKESPVNVDTSLAGPRASFTKDQFGLPISTISQAPEGTIKKDLSIKDRILQQEKATGDLKKLQEQETLKASREKLMGEVPYTAGLYNPDYEPFLSKKSKEILNSPAVKPVIQELSKRTSGTGLISTIESVGPETFEELYNAKMAAQAGDPSKLNQFLYQLGNSAPQTAIGVALNFIPIAGKPLATAYWTALSAGEQIQDKGEVYSTSNIAIDVLLDSVLGNTIDSILKFPTKTLLPTLVKTFGSEGGTEVTQDVLKMINNYRIAKTNTEKLAAKEALKEYFTSGQILMTLGVGGLTGAGIGAGAYIINNPNVKKQDQISKEATSDIIQETKKPTDSIFKDNSIQPYSIFKDNSIQQVELKDSTNNILEEGINAIQEIGNAQARSDRNWQIREAEKLSGGNRIKGIQIEKELSKQATIDKAEGMNKLYNALEPKYKIGDVVEFEYPGSNIKQKAKIYGAYFNTQQSMDQMNETGFSMSFKFDGLLAIEEKTGQRIEIYRNYKVNGETLSDTIKGDSTKLLSEFINRQKNPKISPTVEIEPTKLVTENNSTYIKLTETGPGHTRLNNFIDKMAKTGTILQEEAPILKELFGQTSEDLLQKIDYKEDGRMTTALGKTKYTIHNITGEIVELNRENKNIPEGIFARLKMQKNLSQKDIASGTFLHEYGHIGWLLVLNESERQQVTKIFNSMSRQERIDFFLEHDDNAEYYAHNVEEFWAQSFSDYILENKVSSTKMEPLLKRIAKKFFDSIKNLVGRKNPTIVNKMQPLFEKILAGDESTPLTEFANKEPISFKKDLQDLLNQIETNRQTPEVETPKPLFIGETTTKPTTQQPLFEGSKTPTITPEEQSLMEEAKKYKSAEEFVDSQTGRFHGTSGELKKLMSDEEMYSPQNIYGQGFYTTDSHSIADGYSRKGKGATPSIYKISEKGKVPIYNIEQPMEQDVLNAVNKFDIADMYPYKKGDTLRQVYDDIRELSASGEFSTDTAQEYFDSLKNIISEKGYRGIEHLGGKLTGKAEHNVKIYWNPAEDLTYSKYSTKSQLTDIWNKANKQEKPNPLFEGSKTPTITPEEQSLIDSAPQEGSSPIDRFNNAFDNAVETLPPDIVSTIEPVEAVIMGEKNTPIKQRVRLLDYLRTPWRVFERMGIRPAYDVLLTAYENYTAELPINIDKIKSWSKRVTPQSNERIFRFLDGEKIELNAVEMQVATEIKAWLVQWADRLGMKPDERISEYITHIFPVGAKSEFPEEISILINKKIPESVYNPFLLQRTGAEGYIKDTWKALEAYTKRATRKVNMDPALENLKKVSATLTDISQINYLNRYIGAINLRPTELDLLIDNHIKEIFDTRLGVRPTASITKSIRRIISRAKIGASITSFAKNITQGGNTFADLGTRYTTKGYIDLVKFGASELEDNGVLIAPFIEDRTYSAIKKAAEKFDKVLFLNMNASELINRGAAYYGAKAKLLDNRITNKEYKKAFGKEKPENYTPTLEDAIHYGKFVAAKTQFLFGPLDTPIALNSDIAKTAAQFQTFGLKQSEFVLNMIVDREWLKLIRYLISSMLLFTYIGRQFGMDWDDSIKTFKFGPPPAWTFAQDIWKALIKGEDYYGNKLSTEKRLSATGKSLFTNIVPGGAQIKRTIEGVEAVKEGGVRSKEGSPYLFKIDQTPMNYVRGALFGKYNLTESREYYREKEKKAKEKVKQENSKKKTTTTKRKPHSY